MCWRSSPVNGQTKQDADLSDMIWSVAEQISPLSQAFELKAGDAVYSGPSENFGPVVKGDVLVGRIAELPELSVRIVRGSLATLAQTRSNCASQYRPTAPRLTIRPLTTSRKPVPFAFGLRRDSGTA
jgi:Fumarylacetoacetate (FAA) hydrolase family